MEVSPGFTSLVYACPDGSELLGDLYVPEGAGPHPVLLGIPGGAWRYGSRGGFGQWGTYLARHGYGFFAIDHRRAVSGPAYPQAVADVRAALRFLTRQAPAHGLDPGRMGILGSSAGAHLGSLAALAGPRFDPAEADGPEPVVLAMVLAYGVYDLVAHWQACRAENAARGEDFTERFMGFSPWDDPYAYAEASPIRHVRHGMNRMAAFLTWGTEDDAVSAAQSEAFRLALTQARFPVRTCKVPGAGHFWFSEDPIADPRGHTGFVAPRILRFLERFLRQVPSHAGG